MPSVNDKFLNKSNVDFNVRFHEDPQLHLIGGSIGIPDLPAAVGGTITAGVSELPARADHVHGTDSLASGLLAQTSSGSNSSSSTGNFDVLTVPFTITATKNILLICQAFEFAQVGVGEVQWQAWIGSAQYGSVLVSQVASVKLNGAVVNGFASLIAGTYTAKARIFTNATSAQVLASAGGNESRLIVLDMGN